MPQCQSSRRRALLRAAFCCAVLLATPAAAQQRTVEYPAGSTEVNVDGRAVALSWDAGTIEATRVPDSPISLRFVIALDLTDVQSLAAQEFNRDFKSEECGDRLSVSGARLLPATGETASLAGRAHYERWECVSLDVPETRCEDTWIRQKLPFGGELKTKGVPSCRVEMKSRTAKTRLFETTGDIEVSVRPRIDGDALAVTATVTRADLERGGDVIRMLHLDDDLRALVQEAIDKELRSGLRVDLPKMLGSIKAMPKSVAFTDRGSRVLGARISATATVSVTDFLKLRATE